MLSGVVANTIFEGELMSRQGVITAALIVWVTALTHAQGARTVRDGVYSDAQATRGQAIYQKQCASCHGAKLEGLQGPPLIADAFLSRWHTQPLSDLAGKIRNTMPVGAPGSLTPQQSTDLVAFILKSGSFPAGKTDLAADEATLGKITWPAGLVAAAAPAAGQRRVYPPLGNMAQLMRGIFFPNSNLLFTVQTRDPGAPAAKPSAENQNAGFSFVDWGAGVYGGWELVDNAALALADASPLMLVPMRCENGKPAPVTDPEWIKFTEDLIEVSRRMYRLSQTRNQEAVSDATGDLSDACAACHQVYRESRGRGGRPLDPTDPSNKANRCTPRPAK
jgi:S-disulfanyl-L-cysteine oxidoreductase SoxD